MNRFRFSFVAMALAMGLLVPVAPAQKPPGPAPAPPAKPTQPAAAPNPLQPTQPVQPEDLVLFLHGRIATNDGTSLPNDALVERICNNKVRQQVYASLHGDFSMQLGSRFDSLIDATGESAMPGDLAKKDLSEGIPRRELLNCELRASAAGFRSNSISLVEVMPTERTIDVGAIVVERAVKIKGTTVSATPYKAPPDARKAYEKGVEAESNGKLGEARKYFEQAVNLYAQYTSAWFQLGKIFEKEKQIDSARAAYIRATAIDTRFVPARLSLAALAYHAENWNEVLQLTDYVINHDLLNQGNVAGYVLDLDEVNPAAAYFYNAVANYRLNKFEEAEKSALKAEHIDLPTNFPQLHLLLAKILDRKKDYAGAILHLRAYLELSPGEKDKDRLQAYLARLENLNRSAQGNEKPAPN